jgi:hypothetical protein
MPLLVEVLPVLCFYLITAEDLPLTRALYFEEIDRVSSTFDLVVEDLDQMLSGISLERIHVGQD